MRRLVFVVWMHWALGVWPAPLGAADAAMAARLQERIEAYHRGDAPRQHPLKVVYFHPKGVPPQRGYQERIHRILQDTRSFLLTEMERNGFARRTIRLEEGEAGVKIHLVEGREGVEGYNYDFRYGEKILREMKNALKGEVDFDREYVLVFCGICPRDEKGEYHFRSPYYGWGGSGIQRGLCFAADCEMLDTRHFTNTVDRIRYTEHLGQFEKTLAAFNCLYIGGIAHELGHGLGLPHNREKPWEYREWGRALMGSGNYTYRTELTGGKGSFLTRASALRLATHPMFTNGDRGRFQRERLKEPELKFEPVSGSNELRIRGKASGDPELLAVIAYTDPDGGSNYDAHTWIGEVRNGSFDLTVRVHRNGRNTLRLQFLHLNGAVSTRSLAYEVKDGAVDPLEIQRTWVYTRAEALYMQGDRSGAVRMAKAHLTPDAAGKMAAKLLHLVDLTKDRPVTLLDRVEGDQAWLSAVEWLSAEVGWGRPARDQYHSGRGIADGVCIEIDGRFHARALYAHAPARHVYQLDGRWRRFTAVAGLQVGVTDQGSGVFVVKGDGRELFRSTKLRGTGSVVVEVDVSGVRRLELVTESGKGDNHGCWTVWGSPQIHR